MASALSVEEIRKLRPKVSPGQETDQKEFTGERFLPGYVDGSIELEHVHRYCFALPFAASRRVLDVACGEGYGSDLLGQVAETVVGLDIDGASIDRARQRYSRHNLSFKACSATEIPFEDHSFDVIVSFETVEHLRDQNAFWSEVKRVMRPGGIFLLSSPNRSVYGSQRSTPNPFHRREFTHAELVSELSGRFSHHRVFSQSIVFGSLLVPAAVESIPQTRISLDPTSHGLTWQIDDEAANPYSVVIASDGMLPAVPQSLYTGNYPPGAMASLVGGIVERDQITHALRLEIAELKRSLGAALTSAKDDRDQQALTAKRMEETWLQKESFFALKQEEAALRIARIEETLAEKDQVIEALRSLVEECQQSLVHAAVARTKRYCPEGGH
jgi:SAM-dependent methyltransferase